MSYYNHASEMKLKLGRWSEGRKLRNFEVEALDGERRVEEANAEITQSNGICVAALQKILSLTKLKSIE